MHNACHLTVKVHASKGSYHPHSTRQIRFHGTKVPQGDLSSISEGKSVMTLMRPKKNVLRSSQIRLIRIEVLIFGLISSIKQSIQVIFTEPAALVIYSILSGQQSCAASFLLHAVTSRKTQWDKSSSPSGFFLLYICSLPPAVNPQPVSRLVLVSTSVLASACPDKDCICCGVVWGTKVATDLFFM